MISQSGHGRNHPALSSSDAALEFKRDFIALIPQLCTFARRLCRCHDFADDMSQEALAKAWRARDQFKPGTNLKAWLFTILRNQVYSEARRAWRKIQWDDECGNNIPAPASQQEHAMDVSDTGRALRILPKNQRDAVILVAAGGLSYEVAAKLCGTRVPTIKGRVSRGRARLRALIHGGESLAPRSAVRGGEASEDILAQLSFLTSVGAAKSRQP